jgi:hypothetical protein
LRLHEVFELDHQLGVLVEYLEAANPVLQSQVCLLVWIQFCIDLLKELLGHVEASKTFILLNECRELCIINLVCVFGCIVEAVLNRLVVVRNAQTDLLDGIELPAESAYLFETTSHAALECR